MYVNARQAVESYQANRSWAVEAMSWYKGLRVHAQQLHDRANAQAVAARMELAQAYLPTLDAEAIARAEKQTGFRGLTRRDPLQAMAREKSVLEKTIARIRAEERYQNRELLAGPDGTITTKLVETREMLEPWTAECRKFEDLDGFIELVHIGYDTPAFSEGWWQASYWRHWSQGDHICEALGLDDFGDDVLPAYRKATEQRDFWLAEVKALEDQQRAVLDLVQQHDQAVARLPQLPALYLQQSQALLAEYLDQADYSLLEDWLKQDQTDRAVLAGLRKCAGLKMKERYLQEIEAQALGPIVGDLERRAEKYNRKISKYLRPKYGWSQIPESDLDAKFQFKYAKLRNRRDKWQKMLDRIDAYDRYDRFALDNEPELWWYELTQSRPPRHLSRTRLWYDGHPEIRPEHDEWEDVAAVETARAVAEATVATQPDDVGYLS